MEFFKQFSNERELDCPVCGKYKLNSAYAICGICFWENDPIQYDNPTLSGGANNLSLYDYKKWWNRLKEIMPNLMEKYKVMASKLSLWTYDEMVVPRKNIKELIGEITKRNIEIRISFYNACDKYGYKHNSFVGFPCVKEETIEKANNKSLEIVFSDNPIEICEKYKLKQLLEILSKSEDKLKTWEILTPHISIMPNPKYLPKD